MIYEGDYKIKMKDKLLTLLPNYKTKNSLIFNILKEKIISGEIKPNERLIIRNIASSLGVSETPVREALKMLEAKGLVSSIPHVGAVVTKLNLKEIKDILVIRFNLECLATKLAVDNISIEEIYKLNIKVKEMAKCIEQKDYVNFGHLNRKFHQIIYNSTKNQVLYKLIFDLWDKTERVRSVFSLDPGLMNKSHSEHIKLIEAFKSKDKNLTVKIVEEQKERASSTLLKYSEKDNG